jgi:hypothetical protein
MIIFALMGTTPESLYPKLSGVGSLAVLILMFGASIAVLVYFQRNRETHSESILKSLVAPALAACGLGGVSYLAIVNYSDLIGGTGAITVVLLVVTFAIPILGFVYARVLHKKRPETYLRIGRQKL